MLIALDQLIKHWAVQSLAPLGTAPLIPGFMQLHYVENTGMAFSLLAGRQTLLLVITGAILLFGVYILLFKRPKQKLAYFAVVLIFCGGAGNWIDRFLNGYVVDYLAPQFINFAVFNFADILVCLGVGLMLLAFIQDERAQKAANAAAKEAQIFESKDGQSLHPGQSGENANGEN